MICFTWNITAMHDTSTPVSPRKRASLSEKVAAARSFRIKETLSAAKKTGLIGAAKEDRIRL